MRIFGTNVMKVRILLALCPFSKKRWSSCGCKAESRPCNRMTERVLSVAVKGAGLRPARPTARARALDGIGSGEHDETKQAAKEKVHSRC